jgi:hypothetical protein
MRSQLHGLPNACKHPRFIGPRSFDARSVRLRLGISQTWLGRTHPFNCPISYPREVITGKSKAYQQRKTPEQVRFDHGYSTRMKGSTLEIDEIRHRRAGGRQCCTSRGMDVSADSDASSRTCYLVNPTHTKVYLDAHYSPSTPTTKTERTFRLLCMACGC